MPKYASSTHHAHWIFDRETLSSLRIRQHAKIASQLHSLLPQASPVQLELTDEESSLVVSSLLSSLLKVAKFCNFPPSASWTAGNYLQRFYLLNSLYEHDPMQMMFTALFLASKAEELNISLKIICESVKACEEKRVRAYEVGLLKGIRYQLYVFSPYRSFHCLWSDISPSIPESDREPVKSIVLSTLESLLLTDWLFLEPPAVLALIALISALQSRIDLEEVVTEVLVKYGSGRPVRELVEIAGIMKRDVDAAVSRTIGQEGHFRSAIKKVMGIHKRLYRSKPTEGVQGAEQAER